VQVLLNNELNLLEVQDDLKRVHKRYGQKRSVSKELILGIWF
jgi:hypothetical protein